MSNEVSADPDAISIPASAAEAWAAVYIDVAEKLDAEQKQQEDGTARHARADNVLPAETLPIEEITCPSI